MELLKDVTNTIDIGLAILHQANLPLKYWSYAFHQANLPLNYWSYAFQTSVYLINRLPMSILTFSTPYEKLFHQKLKLQQIKSIWLFVFSLVKTIYFQQT